MVAWLESVITEEQDPREVDITIVDEDGIVEVNKEAGLCYHSTFDYGTPETVHGEIFICSEVLRTAISF